MNQLHDKRRRDSNLLPTLNSDAKVKKQKMKITVAEKFWECFSLKENSRFIMSTKINKKSIPPVHGIRALGALWIFAGHVYYYAFGPIDNLQLIFSYANAWVLQPMFAAAISVDSFYVMRYKFSDPIKRASDSLLAFSTAGFYSRTCSMRSKRRGHQSSS